MLSIRPWTTNVNFLSSSTLNNIPRPPVSSNHGPLADMVSPYRQMWDHLFLVVHRKMPQTQALSKRLISDQFFRDAQNTCNTSLCRSPSREIPRKLRQQSTQDLDWNEEMVVSCFDPSREVQIAKSCVFPLPHPFFAFEKKSVEKNTSDGIMYKSFFTFPPIFPHLMIKCIVYCIQMFCLNNWLLSLDLDQI